MGTRKLLAPIQKKNAMSRVNAVVEKRRRKAWVLFALIMKKFVVAAVNVDKLTPLLCQAASKTAGSTKTFDVTFAALAKEYLGEYEAGMM